MIVTGLGTELKINLFYTIKRRFKIKLVILLTWIRIRIHKILCNRIRIQSIWIHVTDFFRLTVLLFVNVYAWFSIYFSVCLIVNYFDPMHSLSSL